MSDEREDTRTKRSTWWSRWPLLLAVTFGADCVVADWQPRVRDAAVHFDATAEDVGDVPSDLMGDVAREAGVNDIEVADVPTDDGGAVLNCEAGLVPCLGACRDPRITPQCCGRPGNTRSCQDQGGARVGVVWRCGPTSDGGPGVCIDDCERSQQNCGGDFVRDGCQTDLTSNPNHCGSCGMVCPTGLANGTRECRDGICGVACSANFGNCDTEDDGGVSNGCETRLDSPNNCGACRRQCRFANADAGCADGGCTFACAPNFADCDRNSANGCETPLLTSTTHCGACGRACDAGACVNGACTNNCNSPLTMCAGACVDPRTNLAHCGRCATACANSPTQSSTCVDGRCANMPCPANTAANCDGDPGNGCEVNLLTDPANCGRCGNAFPGHQCSNGVLLNTAENAQSCGESRGNCNRSAVENRCAVGECAKLLGRLAAGDRWTCFLRSTSTTAAGPYELWCWGRYPSRMSAGNAPERVLPIESFGPVKAISGRHQHLCAIVETGNQRWVVCSGSNTYGELGPTGDAGAGPVRVNLPGNVRQVAAHANVTCALTEGSSTTDGGVPSNRQVWCWGRNNLGQLGRVSPSVSSTPLEVTFPPSVVPTEIAVGPRSACAVTLDGRLFCWGNNRDGVLGSGSPRDVVLGPTEVPAAQVPRDGVVTPTRYVSVDLGGVTTGSDPSAGATHACALVMDRYLHVRCWGANTQEQALPSSTSSTDAGSPAIIPAPRAIYDGTFTMMSLALGGEFSCVLRNIGTTYCWGSPAFGATARPNRTRVFGGVSGVSPWVLADGGTQPVGASVIAAGPRHVCALVRGDSNPLPEVGVVCWGANEFGQLGDNTVNDSDVPVRVRFP